MAGLVLLITGTRMPLTGSGKEVVSFALDGLIGDPCGHDALIVMHGDCPTGVDNYVGYHAGIDKSYLWPFPAKWKEQGKPAGMARNTHMVRTAQAFKLYGHEVMCLAFPSRTYGTGTQHCIREAKRYGLTTRVHPLEPAIDHNLTR